jgi:hypothetical protein
MNKKEKNMDTRNMPEPKKITFMETFVILLFLVSSILLPILIKYIFNPNWITFMPVLIYFSFMILVFMASSQEKAKRNFFFKLIENMDKTFIGTAIFSIAGFILSFTSAVVSVVVLKFI